MDFFILFCNFKINGILLNSCYPPFSKHEVAMKFKNWFIYLLIGFLVFLAWLICQKISFTIDNRYWLGVSGVTLMFLSFSYPLRKYLKFMQPLGKIKWWFIVHIFFGMMGPFLILLHSNFHLQSTNSKVAFWSMVTVVLSGVIGRFYYLSIQENLNDKKNSLERLKQKVGLDDKSTSSRLRFSLSLIKELLEFETFSQEQSLGGVMLLPFKKFFVYSQCHKYIHQDLKLIADEKKWSIEKFKGIEKKTASLALDYLNEVVHICFLTRFEKLFRFWHLLHAPLVYLLVMTTLFHVWAVYAY